MHRIISCVVCLVLSFVLFSCSDDNGEVEKQQTGETVIVFMPWTGAASSSNGLLAFFQNNISDMKKAMAETKPAATRLLVCIAEDAGSARLFEITADGKEKTLRKYVSPDMYSSQGICSLLTDAKTSAPAARYSMIVAGHGLGWVSKDVYNAETRGALRVLAHRRQDAPLTRFFGHATDASRQIDVATLSGGIEAAGMKLHFLLFDGCNMANVETAFALRSATDYLVACPTEIMGYGMPYREILPSLMKGDFQSACDRMITFYENYSIATGGVQTPYPYATISVTKTSELAALALLMKRMNASCRESVSPDAVQRLDGYSPTLFFDLGAYVAAVCDDAPLLDALKRQIELTVPYKGHTPSYYTSYGNSHVIAITAYSGITVSDLSENRLASDKQTTDWWKATH